MRTRMEGGPRSCLARTFHKPRSRRRKEADGTHGAVGPPPHVGGYNRSAMPGFYQVRKATLGTDGVRVTAKIPHDLQQSLLRSCCSQSLLGRPAKQPLSRQFENGIILPRWPRKIASLDLAAQRLVPALDGAHPQPGKNDVHGKVCCARRAQQRLRSVEIL